MDLYSLTLYELSSIDLLQLSSLSLIAGTTGVSQTATDPLKKMNVLSGSINGIRINSGQSVAYNKFTLNDRITTVDMPIGDTHANIANSAKTAYASPIIGYTKDRVPIRGSVVTTTFSIEKQKGISFGTGQKPSSINI